MVSGEKSDIVIYESMSDGHEYYLRLKETNLFDKVYYFEHTDEENKSFHPIGKNPFSRYKKEMLQMEQQIDFSFLRNKEIYIYNDCSLIGTYINLKKTKYHLIEDGLNCYKNGVFLSYNPTGIKKHIRKLMHWGTFCFSESPFMKSLEINDSQGVKLKSLKKVIVVPRKQLFEQLTEDQKQTILYVFLGNDGESLLPEQTGDCSVLVTQPLSQDGILSSQEIQIEMYKKIIEQYGIGHVFIKPHPRENIDYEQYFSDCTIIKFKNVPIEILGFIKGLTFKRAFTAFSTAVENMSFCEEACMLSLDWVKDFEQQYLMGLDKQEEL